MRAVRTTSPRTATPKPKGSSTLPELRRLERRLAKDLTTLIQAFAEDALSGAKSTLLFRWAMNKHLAARLLLWRKEVYYLSAMCMSREMARLQSPAPPTDRSSGAPKTRMENRSTKSSSTPLPASKGSRSEKPTRAPTLTPSGTTPRTKGGKHSTCRPWPSLAARA